MPIQIQFRRGSSAEHETFTGAPGEITVDTTENTLRVHDGQTPGGTTWARADAVTDMTGTDYVVAWQSPTADNNYTWYRKYKSGWVEQGGESTGGTIILPIQMLNTHYTVTSGLYYSSGSSWTVGSIRPRDVTSISLNKANADKGWWHVCGIAA
jgi:hypothetical protein